MKTNEDKMLQPFIPQTTVIEQVLDIFDNQTAAQYVMEQNLKELEDIWYGRDT